MVDLSRQKQRFGIGRDESQKGDCWRTCIACILEIDAGYVPHFLQEYGSNYIDATNDYIENLGFKLLMAVDIEFPVTIAHNDKLIKLGSIKNGNGHAVVASASTGEMIHDPDDSGDDSDVEEPWTYIAIVKKEIADQIDLIE